MKFSINDRVEVVGSHYARRMGEVGIIVKVIDCQVPYCVKFEHKTAFTDCLNWMYENQLKLLFHRESMFDELET